MFKAVSLALSVLPLLVSAAPVLDEKRGISRVPVMRNNFPDPAIISDGASWVAYGTNDGIYNVPLAHSSNFDQFTYSGKDALPHVGKWSSGANIWAPDVVQLVSPRSL